MYCSQCGNKLTKDEQFCAKCGTKIEPFKKTNTTNNNENNIDQNIKSNIQMPPSKKLKWWIPVIIFLIPILTVIISTIIGVIFGFFNLQETPIIRFFTYGIFPIIQLICYIGLIPSIIIVIVMYNKN